MVFFGTGQLLTNADRSDLTTQTIFGVLDTMADVPVTVLKTQLQEQKIDAVTYTTVTGRLGTYRKITTGDAAADAFSVVSDANLTAASPKLGWFIDLPESSERLVTSPMVYNDKVLFGTGVPVSAEKCLPGGKGWVMGLNPLTGALTRKANSASGNAFSFIDINGDGKSSTLDKLAFATGSAYMSGYSKDGIPTELTYVSLSSTLTGPADSDSGWGDKGGVIALREANSMAVYTGNQKKDGTVKRGKTIKRAGSVGTGTIYGGVIGSDTLEKDRLLGAPVSAAKVVGSTWREIK
jgi:type IV pilus assembly protein PilY1